MWWMATTFKAGRWSADLEQALTRWADHILERHAKIREVRCFRSDQGTSVTFMEGFGDFHDWQALEDEEDEVCAQVMSAVFAHEVPGTRMTKFWRDILPEGAGRR